MACYLSQRQTPRTSTYDSILSLMKWAHDTSLVPTPPPEDLVQHDLGSQFLVAQNDDPELLEWLAKAEQDGGGFVQGIASAGLRADPENYALIRTLLLVLRRKYPQYEPSDAVKEEIRNRPKEPAQ